MRSRRPDRARRHQAWLALASLALALTALSAETAGAQSPEASPETPSAPEAKPTAEDFAKPMGPPDPLNRGTPRGSMYGFLTAARAGDYDRAAEFLDLRRLPPAEREEGPLLARELKAVLDQKLWVDLASLSDSNDGFSDDGLPEWQDQLGTIQTAEGPVPLLLQRVSREGDGARIWKVAAATVDATPALYDEFGPVWFQAWIPPVFFDFRVLGLELWQWLGFAVAAAAAWLLSLLLAGTIVRLLGIFFTRDRGRIDDRIVLVVRGPVRLALWVVLFSLGRRYLALDLPVQESLQLIERLLLVVAAAWMFFRVIDVAVLALRVRAESRGTLGLLPLMIPGQRFAKVIVVVIGMLAVLGTLGVNITAAVAGLGVGGIAVALAAQRTLENLFGGVTLFADRPVRVGDFCKYGDQVGTVEEIGLRSTRVRSLDRTVISIPNASFSNLSLENYALRDRMRLTTVLGVRYETTPDQLRYLLTRLREVLLAHPRVTDDPARVRFAGFGAYSLDIDVFAYVDTSDWNEFLGIREDVYLQFMEAVSEAGTSFAFPSSTTYLGRDEGLRAEDVDRAEQRVAEWRDHGELPFPSVPETRRREVWNTTPWPPKGSGETPPGE